MLIKWLENSSWSRNGDIIEIGDVSEREALEYLKIRNISTEQAEKIYKLVGGRMIHLKNFGDIYCRTGSFDGMFTALRKQESFLTAFRYAQEDA